MTSGVPQGSILGPLLFVIYINDLPECLENPCIMYADDSKVFAKLDDVGSNGGLTRDIIQLNDWCNVWSMVLNCKKCKVMHKGKKNPELSYIIGNDGTSLESTKVERDLGVIMTSNTSNSLQVQAAVSKANKSLGRLRKSFTYFGTT